MSQPFRIVVRVKPGSKRDRVGGSWYGELGKALVIAVRAPARDGQANVAVRTALARALGVRARAVTVVRGTRGRDKIVEIEDPPDGTELLVDSLRE